MIAEDEHVRGEPDRGRASGDVAERRERVPVRGATGLRHRSRERDVLAARDVVVAEPLRLDGDAGDLGDARRLLPLGVRSGKSRDNRCDDAELHALPLLQRWVTNRVYSAGF